MIRPGSDLPGYDNKWGAYTPDMRINIDQVPLPFCVTPNTTYEEVETGKRVWIASPSPALEKRQATLQVTVSAGATIIKLALIFKGKGMRIKQAEKDAYHPSVDHYFQENAWVNTAIALKHAEMTLKPAVHHLPRFLLFLDNLSSQTCPEYRSAIEKLKGRCHYGVPNATDSWQPIDSGIGRILKKLIFDEQEEWLEEGDNIDRWLGNADPPITASERRILMSQWAGAAHDKLMSSDYDDFRKGAFQRTGTLITADGSDDHLIKPEGMVGYSVDPPARVANIVIQPQEVPESFEPADDVHPVIDVEIDDIGPDDEIENDDANDRDYDHPSVGRNIKALYEAGWQVGTVQYYNKQMKKMHVSYSDNTEDYMDDTEIDGIEVMWHDGPAFAHPIDVALPEPAHLSPSASDPESDDDIPLNVMRFTFASPEKL